MRKEVRERACRLLTRFLDDPFCRYFEKKPATRDAAFRRIEPLLRDESAAVRCAAAGFTCACVRYHHAIETASDPTVRADLLRPYLSAVADYMLHESDDAARERIGDLVSQGSLTIRDGIASVLKKLYPGQPTLDAFVVPVKVVVVERRSEQASWRRKRPRRSKPAVERPPCVSP